MNIAQSSFVRSVVAFLGFVAGFITIIKHVNKTDFPVDMIIYRQGVQAFLDGRSVYSEPMHAGDLALPFIYPPFGALIMLPLTAIPGITDDMAGDIMIVLSDLLVLACVYLVARAIAGATTRTGAGDATNIPNVAWLVPAIWAAALNFEPVDLNDGFAQINIVVMALVVCDLVPRKRWLPQGWLIGLAAAIKITPLAMLLYFLLRKEWKPIAVAAASAALATLAAALFRWGAFVEFFTSKLVDMGSGADFGVGTDYQSNSSIKGAIQRLYSSQESMAAHNGLTSAAWLLCSLAVVAAGAWLMLCLMKRGWDTDAWLVNALVMLLISPVSWSHHWIWLTLVIPVFLFRAWGWRTFTGGSLFTVLAAWTAMLLTTPPKWWFGDNINNQGLPNYQKFLVDDFVWLAILAVTLYALALLRPAPAAPRQSYMRDSSTPAKSSA